ncbi:hypothetical protein M2408_005425 [Sphingobacterium sp. BIGb0165]|nr:hypothetical protein [Sphingobacterium sp. BIGb0165]
MAYSECSFIGILSYYYGKGEVIKGMGFCFNIYWSLRFYSEKVPESCVSISIAFLFQEIVRFD